jgi:hypothetical protein
VEHLIEVAFYAPIIGQAATKDYDGWVLPLFPDDELQ